MIAKVPIYILFVALTKSEIIVGYSFIICIHQFEKCVLFILLLILTQTNKHKKNPLTFSLMYVIQEESGKRRNNCRSKTHFNDAQTVILQLGITTNDFRFESIGAVFNVFFSRVGSFLFLKKELHIERLGTVCVWCESVFCTVRTTKDHIIFIPLF